MTVVYYFIVFLARILDLAILVRVFMSWLPISRDSRFVAIIMEITEPVLAPLRRVIPSVAGMDFAPMVGLILIQITERVLLSALQRFM